MYTREQSTVRPAVTFEVSGVIWRAYRQAKENGDIKQATRLHLSIFYGSPHDHTATVQKLTESLPGYRMVAGDRYRVVHPVLVQSL